MIAGGIDACSMGSSARIAIHGRDDVRARLARHDEQHRRFAVGVSAGPDVFHRIDDVADVLQAHGGAVLYEMTSGRYSLALKS